MGSNRPMVVPDHWTRIIWLFLFRSYTNRSCPVCSSNQARMTVRTIAFSNPSLILTLRGSHSKTIMCLTWTLMSMRKVTMQAPARNRIIRATRSISKKSQNLKKRTMRVMNSWTTYLERPRSQRRAVVPSDQNFKLPRKTQTCMDFADPAGTGQLRKGLQRYGVCQVLQACTLLYEALLCRRMMIIARMKMTTTTITEHVVRKRSPARADSEAGLPSKR